MRHERESVSAGGSGYFALWFSLGAGLFLMPFGAFLVPALSIERAVLATLVAGAAAALLIGAIVALAARSGRSTLDLLAEPFGDRGRWIVALLLLLRHGLFAAFALVLITDSATLIGERSLGVDLRPVWAIAFLLAAALLFHNLHRGWRFWRAWGVLTAVLAVGVTISAYAEFEVPSYLRRPAVGGWPSFWQAVDVMLIFPLLWLPVAADYACFARNPRSAARGAFAGVLLAAAWFGTLGIVYLPAVDSGDIPGFLVGMQLGLGALIFLMVLQLDEVAVSASVARLTITGERSVLGWLAGPAVLLAAFPAALLWHVTQVEPYMLLLGSLFVPAFAIVIAQALWPQRRPLAVPAFAWAGGFLLYQWITPADIGWWRDLLDSVAVASGLPFPLTDDITWLGGAIPAFAFAFAIHALAAVAPAIRPAHQPSVTTG